VRTLTLALGLFLAAGAAFGSEAGDLYKRARIAEKAGEFAQAYLLYAEAAALDPSKITYSLRAHALQSRAALQSKPVPKVAAESDSATEPNILVEPEPHFESLTAKDWAEARKPLPPTELKAAPGRKDLDFRGDAKAVFEQVAKAFGLDCVFDYDYQAGPAFHFEVQQVDYRDALHALEATTASFVVPLSERVMLVVKDTPQKRKDVEPSVSVSIPLPEVITPQDLTGLIAAVQQSMALEKVAWDSAKNTVVIRDRISKVTVARQLFDQLLYPRAQVEVEVDFIEFSRQDLLNYGIILPTSFPILSLTNFMHNQFTVPSGISRLALFGGGATLFGIGIADVSLLANMTKSRAQTLLQSEVRTVDNQAASIHVGQKYPILTAGYFGPQNFSTGGQTYTPPPSFTFEDLGFSLKMTPHIHGMEDVSLDVESEFKLLSGAALNGIPVVANRQFKSTVTLKEGESAVVAGMMSTSEARTISGLAGISTLPLVGRFLRQNNHEDDGEEVLVVIKPRLVTAPPTEALTPVVRVGSEERPFIPL
jgi:hypothetical protein